MRRRHEDENVERYPPEEEAEVKPDPELESHEGKAAPEPETRRKEPARR